MDDSSINTLNRSAWIDSRNALDARTTPGQSCGHGQPRPTSPAFERALVYQWLFFEQYSDEPYIAVLRAIRMYPERSHQATQERVAQLLDGGHRALAVIEAPLSKSRFIAGDDLTVADIALYAYTQDAAFAGYDMKRFPRVAAWLERVAAHHGHIPDRVASTNTIRVFSCYPARNAVRQSETALADGQSCVLNIFAAQSFALSSHERDCQSWKKTCRDCDKSCVKSSIWRSANSRS